VAGSIEEPAGKKERGECEEECLNLIRKWGDIYDDDVTSGSSWSIAYEMHLLQRIPIYVLFLRVHSAIHKTLLVSALLHGHPVHQPSRSQKIQALSSTVSLELVHARHTYVHCMPSACSLQVLIATCIQQQSSKTPNRQVLSIPRKPDQS